MAKKDSMLTPEERLARAERKKEKRKIFGETFLKAAALFLAVVFVYSVTYVAFGKGSTVYQGVQVDAGSLVVGGGSSSGGAASGGAGSSDDAAAPASNEAEEAAKAINAATAAAATAGYDWERNAKMTSLDVGGDTFTNILNGIIQGVDPNANLQSVVGGFLGAGGEQPKKATVKKGGNPAEDIGYHGESYKLKATSLKASDLKDLSVNGDTYTFTLADANTPKKDGSSALSRLTDDIVIKEEVTSEIQAQVGNAVSVTGLECVYKNIKVEVVITDGKLVKLTYSYDAEVPDLAVKAGVTIHGKGSMSATATYSNFVY
ncbi:MAG: hypothetical protein ACI4K8_04755 [Candidatus Fimenecus sp.]